MIFHVRGRGVRIGLTATVLTAMSVASVTAAGPEAGAKVPELKVAVLQSDGSFDESNAAEGDKPRVFFLIRSEKFDRPIARCLKVLDEKLGDYSAQGEVVAVWLTADAEQSKEYVPRVAQSLQMQHTRLAVFADDGSGPAGWNITSDVSLTAVAVAGGRAGATLTFVSANETDVPAIGEALAKAIEKK